MATSTSTSTSTSAISTRPLHTIAGLGYSMNWFFAIGGLSAAEEWNAALYASTYALLQPMEGAFEGFKILSAPPASPLSGALISFQVPDGMVNSEVQAALREEFGIVVKLLPDGEGGTELVNNALRVSHHVFNTAADYQALANALRTLFEARRVA